MEEYRENIIDSKGNIVPFEPVPSSMSEWSEIDRRVDLVGRGDKVHDLSRLKGESFSWWQIIQTNPGNKNQFIYVWNAFIK